MFEEIENLYEAVNNPEQVQEATVQMMKYLQDPGIFEAFFQIIQSPKSDNSIKSSLTYMSRAITIQKQTLSPELLQIIKSNLLNLAFTPHSQEIIDLICLVIEKILEIDPISNFPELIEQIFNSISSLELVTNSITYLPSVLSYLEEEQINENIDQFFAIIDSAITSNSWPVRSSAFLILQKLCKKSNELNVTQHIIPIQNYEHSTQIFNQPQTKKYLKEIWSTFFYLVSNKNVEKDFITEIYPLILEISSNSGIEPMTRILVLQSVSVILEDMDENQISQIFDLVFNLGTQILASDGTFEQIALFIFESALENLDPSAAYSLVKQRIETAFSSADVNSQAFGIYILSEVITVSPEISNSDITFLSQTMTSALDLQNDLLSESVCIFVNSSVQAFSTATTLCCSLIRKVVPLFISESPSLRTAAFDAVHSLCDVVDGSIDNFFSLVFQLVDQIPENNRSSFNTILADAINKDEEVGDDEIDSCLEYVSHYFNEIDFDDSSSVLLIVSSILKKDESQSSDILEPAVSLAVKILEEGNAMSKIDVIDFVYDIFPQFSEIFMSDFKILTDKIYEIAKSVLNEGNQDEEKDNVVVDAINTSCLVAKQLKSREMASILAKSTIFVIKNDAESYSKDISQSIASIAEYIDDNESLELFNLLTTIMNETENEEIVTDFILAYENLISHSSESNKMNFLETGYSFIIKFFTGELSCLEGKNPFQNHVDFKLMSQIGYLIGDVIKFNIGEASEQLCNYMLEVLKMPNNLAAFSFIGSFSDAIENGNCSNQVLEELLTILSEIIETASDPDMLHNICYLLNVIVQKHPEIVNSVMSFSEQIWQWFTTALEDPVGWGLFLSNVASLFLTLSLFDNVPNMIISTSLKQFPPVDLDETENMAKTIIKLFDSNKINDEIIESLIFSLANFVLLSKSDLEERSVSNDVYNTIKGYFIRLMSSDESKQLLSVAFSKQRSKLSKLQKLLQ
ncbi:hypothetical protein TVAG_345120 [Trichomonas vaginalis G3]|uniref:Importin N-terminal domain-containing protein n=1 Tax=Trichomonas vaginalis (strain ATCC PRA-98 / G3) TaxID=412133 RepID=A2G692_TRIV3|nr:armadillo (ARM) repeat-containing protein family [Trichomonas vaginalis G3]EAX87330.1 hypothetical protein TVAG_345120 [Trichomonas vaginalis G3]KAI5490336.1 armadillo (ARM) repeat-containing protein family [Trichomonas vaginalis G3]|eukprot:XP_001300260.1 hypothetical protein [Trichomonas vaginalis G3]